MNHMVLKTLYKDLGTLEMNAWKQHNVASNLPPASMSYIEEYNKFFDIWLTKDSLIFSVADSNLLRLSIKRLISAVQIHDYIEAGLLSNTAKNWGDAYDALVDYHKNLGYIEHADQLSVIMIQQWKYHHARDYINFSKATKSIYSIYKGADIPDNTINLFVKASIAHDLAEKGYPSQWNKCEKYLQKFYKNLY